MFYFVQYAFSWASHTHTLFFKHIMLRVMCTYAYVFVVCFVNIYSVDDDDPGLISVTYTMYLAVWLRMLYKYNLPTTCFCISIHPG